MKKHSSTILLVLIFLIGFSVMAYPTVSNWWNARVQSRAIAVYQEAVEQLTEAQVEEMWAQADAYNAQLRGLTYPFLEYNQLTEYNSVLNLNGDGIIGYITIEKINVNLPIYHGTAETVLDYAAGHLEGTSLPVGGESTHSVISAHRGLPRAKLFTDLDRLQVGDTFTITILNRTLTYQVDQILIVEPSQMEALNITDGQDYCTLQTCTPYGINTHRMLVRGKRLYEADRGVINVSSDATEVNQLVVIVVLALPMLLIFLTHLMIKYRKKK